MYSKPKKWVIVTAAIVLLFVLTNPSPKRFKEDKGYKPSYGGVERTVNGVAFSIYSVDGQNYLGILMNFIPLN